MDYQVLLTFALGIGSCIVWYTLLGCKVPIISDIWLVFTRGCFRSDCLKHMRHCRQTPNSLRPCMIVMASPHVITLLQLLCSIHKCTLQGSGSCRALSVFLFPHLPRITPDSIRDGHERVETVLERGGSQGQHADQRLLFWG